jgi:hypothetical protein
MHRTGGFSRTENRFHKFFARKAFPFLFCCTEILLGVCLNPVNPFLPIAAFTHASAERNSFPNTQLVHTTIVDTFREGEEALTPTSDSNNLCPANFLGSANYPTPFEIQTFIAYPLFHGMPLLAVNSSVEETVSLTYFFSIHY